jgi:hypothetical protein
VNNKNKSKLRKCSSNEQLLDSQHTFGASPTGAAGVMMLMREKCQTISMNLVFKLSQKKKKSCCGV